MTQTFPDLRTWLRHAHGHGRVYMTQARKRSGVWVYQFYTVTPSGLTRLAPEDPKSPVLRDRLTALGWDRTKSSWNSQKSGNSLLTEATASLGWREFQVDWEVLR